MLLKFFLCVCILVLATEPGFAQQNGDSAPHSLPASVLNGETYLYTDISLVNATDSLDRIMKMNLVTYTFLHDSVEGRRLTGVLPRGKQCQNSCAAGVWACMLCVKHVA